MAYGFQPIYNNGIEVTPRFGSTYQPKIGDYGIADLSKFGINQNNSNGFQTPSLQTINTGLTTLQTIGNLWSTWQQNKLARKAFDLNKKNFALSKDAYERRLRRSDNLTRRLSGESMDSIIKDQLEFNRVHNSRIARL